MNYIVTCSTQSVSGPNDSLNHAPALEATSWGEHRIWALSVLCGLLGGSIALVTSVCGVSDDGGLSSWMTVTG